MAAAPAAHATRSRKSARESRRGREAELPLPPSHTFLSPSLSPLSPLPLSVCECASHDEYAAPATRARRRRCAGSTSSSRARLILEGERRSRRGGRAHDGRNEPLWLIETPGHTKGTAKARARARARERRRSSALSLSAERSLSETAAVRPRARAKFEARIIGVVRFDESKQYVVDPAARARILRISENLRI